MRQIIIEHFENGILTFDDDKSFIEFVQRIWKENEEDQEEIISPIETLERALNYIRHYCANFKIINCDADIN